MMEKGEVSLRRTKNRSSTREMVVKAAPMALCGRRQGNPEASHEKSGRENRKNVDRSVFDLNRACFRSSNHNARVLAEVQLANSRRSHSRTNK
jgi:hypothetical protein